MGDDGGDGIFSASELRVNLESDSEGEGDGEAHLEEPTPFLSGNHAKSFQLETSVNSHPIKIETEETHPYPGDKSGWLSKRGAKHPGYKKRYFELRHNQFRYYKKQKAQKAKGFIELDGAEVKKAPESGGRNKFVFTITTRSNSRTYVLSASDQPHLEDWVNHIEKVILYLSHQKRNKSSQAPSHTRTGSDSKVKPPEPLKSTRRERKLLLDCPFDFRRNAGISDRILSWRKELNLEGIEGGFRSSITDFTHELFSSRDTDVTSCALHNTMNAIAVASYSRQSLGMTSPGLNLDRSRGLIQIIHVKDGNKDSKMFSSVRRFPQEGSGICPDISWIDNDLVCGSTGGNAYYYQCNPSTPVTDVNGLLKSKGRYYHKNSEDVTDTGYVNSTKIRRVQIEPQSKGKFLSLVNNWFYLWDLNREEKPLFAQVASSSALLATCWNPHNSNNFLFGGVRRSINIIDARNLTGDHALALKISNAHGDSIRDIAWSPLVEYWLASAGDDGCVKVWDIRMQRWHLANLQGHSNSVTRLAWSRSHVEMLISGATDRSLKLWNLRLAPHYLVHNDSEEFNGSVIGVGFSPLHSLQYFGVSLSEIRAAELTRDILKRFVPLPEEKVERSEVGESKGDGEVRSERTVMTSLYCRDYAQASRGIAALVEGYWEKRQINWTESLFKLSADLFKLPYPSLFETAVEDLVAFLTVPVSGPSSSQAPESRRSERESKEREIKKDWEFLFSEWLEKLATYIPPKALKLSEVNSESRDAVRSLELRLKLHSLRAQGKYQAILQLKDEICSKIKTTDGKIFSAETLEELVGTILRHDHLQAIQFALAIAKTLNEIKKFRQFVEIANILLSPTIYDNTVNITTMEGEDVLFKPRRKWHSETVSPGGGTGSSSSAASGDVKDRKSISQISSPGAIRAKSSSRLNLGLPPTSEIPEDNEMEREISVSRSQRRGSRDGGSVAERPAMTGRISRSSSRLITDAQIPSLDNIDSRNAEIIVDREMRNPKIVMEQLELLLDIYSAVGQPLPSYSSVQSPSSVASPVSSSKERPLPPSTSMNEKIISPISPMSGKPFNPYLPFSQLTSLVTSPSRFEDEKDGDHDAESDEEGEMVIIDPEKQREVILQLPKLTSESCKKVIDIYDNYEKPKTDSYEKAKEIKKVIPTIVHKLYFNALLLENSFDKVFIRGTYLIKALGNNEFSHVLQKLLDKVALPCLTKYVDETLQNGIKPPNVLKLARAALELMNLVYNCEYLPDALHEVAPHFFENLIKSQRAALTNMLTDSKQNKESKDEWKQNIEKVLKYSEDLRKSAVESGRFSDLQQNPRYQKLHAQILDFNKILQSYLSSSSK